MTSRPPLRLSFITDELHSTLDAGIAFAREEGLEAIEIRMIDDRNFLSLGPAEWLSASARIRAAGLTVDCLATPLLKWSPPGRAAAAKGDQFAFDPGSRSLAEWARHAAEAAHTFGTRNLRIFSWLTYDGFNPHDLAEPLGVLLPLAEQEDLVLHLENEPVCNVRTVGDLTAVMAAWPHPRLRALLDIPNQVSSGSEPSDEQLAALMPSVDRIHFKDWSRTKRRIVALGEGDIPWPRLIAKCLGAAGGRTLALTIETHVPDDQPGATRRSLAHLRRLVA
jgi:sugar phosphate isomerase/epimerase